VVGQRAVFGQRDVHVPAKSRVRPRL